MIGWSRPNTPSNSMFHAVSHGQSCGSVKRRADDEIRAGTETIVRRRVPVVAFIDRGSPVSVAAAAG